jgi:hypothetical protein
MPEVSWELNIKVSGGPQIAESDTLTVEAYEEIRLIIENKAQDKKIEVQLDGAGQIMFVLITSSKYLDDKVSYALKSGGDKIILDAPHFFIGEGIIKSLGKLPKEIFVTNKLDENVTLTILVGRDATP